MMFLTELCAELKNYFLRDVNKDIHAGVFAISSGNIGPLDFLQIGQYYRIVGSIFNDGVHVYGSAETLSDETFDGAIWAMAVPPAVVDLAGEIDAWRTANADVLASPYASESFGGYSYTKVSGATEGNSGAIAVTWQGQFASRLRKWRRLSVL